MAREKKVKQKKQILRVDFTPMVDMNMLLITFFMFCTTLSKPQTMEISMPDREASSESKPIIKSALTILMDENDKVYYYEDLPNLSDYTSLHETNYSADGLRNILLGRNKTVIDQVEELKKQHKNGLTADTTFQRKVAQAKGSKDAMVVLIKPANAAKYANLVDVLDEMLICNVGKYTVSSFTPADIQLIDNYKNKRNSPAAPEL